jgi:preprotein translocase SecE subunit
MAVGIHKPGQGYWVRVLTACYLGVLVLACAAWTASQARLILENIPKHTFELSVANQAGSVSPGQTVTLFAPVASDPNGFSSVGTARVVEFDAASHRLTLTDAVPASGSETMEWERARKIEVPPAAAGAPPVFTSTFNGRAAGVPVIEPVLLQGIIAATVIVLGTVLVLMFVAWNAKTVDFLIATDMEMRKVNWSTRKDVIASTWVVIFTSVLLAVGLFAVDYGFKTFFQVIGILVK